MNLHSLAAAHEERSAIESLVASYRDHSAKIGIVGLGYVGLPMAITAASRGFQVLGFDVDEARVAMINDGQSIIKHMSPSAMLKPISKGLLRATTDLSRLDIPDVIMICVPTPLTRNREPDLSFIREAASAIARRLRKGQLIVLESTTYPGTTEEVLRPILEESGLESGRDFFLAFSPEREDPGNPNFSTATIPKVVGGNGPAAQSLAVVLYDQLVAQTVPVSSAKAAEAVKLTENIFRAVNIALVNELKVIYDAMGIDIWEVIEAAKTKPFGFMAFYPGPGLGGHCIPVDPFYLTWKAREYEISARFVELAGEINTNMPHVIVSRVAEALDRRVGRGTSGSRILILGIAYKKNIDDLRESPALKLIDLLEKRGASVEYHDPFFPEIPASCAHFRLVGRKSAPLDAATISACDAVLIATDHDGVDYELVVANAKVVVDTRNVCQRVGLVRDNIVKA